MSEARTTRFLIDNCLTPSLAAMAREAGYEAMALRDLEKGGYKDWDLVPVIAEGRWTFVTKNSRDFRGAADQPGLKGQYTRLPEHEGLVCLNGPVGMDLRMQKELFRTALDHLRGKDDPRGDDLANQVLEVTLEAAEAEVVDVGRYDLPPGSWGQPEARLQAARQDDAVS